MSMYRLGARSALRTYSPGKWSSWSCEMSHELLDLTLGMCLDAACPCQPRVNLGSHICRLAAYPYHIRDTNGTLSILWQVQDFATGSDVRHGFWWKCGGNLVRYMGFSHCILRPPHLLLYRTIWGSSSSTHPLEVSAAQVKRRIS